ncbi:MAG: AraC family transcriptional regulator, partial [Planctomycetota bacterium]
MNYYPFSPPSPIGQFVETVFHLENYNPEHSHERIVPDTSANLVIELDDQERWIADNETKQPIQTCRRSWVSGPHRGYFSISALPKTELIGVRFRIGGLFPLIKSSIDDLVDRVVDGEELFGQSILDLRSSAIEAASSEEKVNIVVDWLDNTMDWKLAVPSDIQTAIDSICTSPTQQTLAACVDNSTFSQKHMIHLFRKHTGLRPRELQRILRFSRAIATVQGGEQVDWVTLSHDCGYSDQSHFIRDFKHFS